MPIGYRGTLFDAFFNLKQNILIGFVAEGCDVYVYIIIPCYPLTMAQYWACKKGICCPETRICPHIREYVLIALHFLLDY